MDLRIQRSVVSHLRSRPKPLEIGPFVAGLDPDTASPHINYACPVPGTRVTSADVADLISVFTREGRKPRLEYVTSCAPELEDLLLEAGFTVEARHQYLVCTPLTLTLPPAPEGLILTEPATDPDRAALVAAVNEAFGEAPEATDGDVARIRRGQERGGVALIARTASGEYAGGGRAMAPFGGLSEIGGIGVRAPFRRRGLAGAITAEIARRAFAAGVESAWLEADGDDSWRVYERVGFLPGGHRLYISRD